MERIAEIEQDILYGDGPTNVPTASKPTPGAKAPAKVAPAPPKPSPVEVVRNFLKRQAGPLPVWGWGTVGLGAVTLTGIIVGVCRHRRGY